MLGIIIVSVSLLTARVYIVSQKSTVNFPSNRMDSNRKRDYFVDLLAITFGISAWIGITATFLQLPQIVQTAPEGWNLPSYIVILTQSGNIASLIYIIYEKWSTVKFDDVNLIYSTLGIGCVASILMAFYYQNTVYFANQERSIPLFVFTAMFAIVGCLSSVLFMPFMGRFRGIYLVTYMFGQGLNGLLSSVLSLVQGVGSPQCIKNGTTNETSIAHSQPLFEPKYYFLFVFGVLILSFIAFVLLNKLDVCKKEYAEAHRCEIETVPSNGVNGADYQPIPTDAFHISPANYWYLMFIISAVSCLTYGILPGIQSFSCLSYGPSAYHLSTTLSSIANPLACLVCLYISRPSVGDISTFFAITALLAAYILTTAIESPTPPFHSTSIGNYLIVSSTFRQYFNFNHF